MQGTRWVMSCLLLRVVVCVALRLQLRGLLQPNGFGRHLLTAAHLPVVVEVVIACQHVAWLAVRRDYKHH